MKILKEDLEEIIFSGDREILRKNGLALPKRVSRKLKSKVFGLQADLVSIDRIPIDWKEAYAYSLPESHRKTEITVFEIRADKISVSSFMQAIEYAAAIKSWLNCRMTKNVTRQLEIHPLIHICLIGRSIDYYSAINWLPALINGMDFKLSIYTYEYSLEGLKFHNQTGLMPNVCSSTKVDSIKFDINQFN